MHFQCITTHMSSVGQTPVVQTHSMEVLHSALVSAYKSIIPLPVYMYHDNHSWHLTTSAYERNNDELIGYIFVVKGAYKKAHGIKSLTAPAQVKILRQLMYHLSRYDQFINNGVKMISLQCDGKTQIIQNLYDLQDIRQEVEIYLDGMEQ